MKNITLNVQPPHRGAHYLFICNEYATVGVQGLHINWNGNKGEVGDEGVWWGVENPPPSSDNRYHCLEPPPE